MALLAGAAISVGYVRHYWLLHPAFPPDHIRSVVHERTSIYLEGVLYREPDRFPQRERWMVRAQRIWHPTGAQEIRGNLLVTLRHTAREWEYGDRLRLRATPAIPHSFGNPGGFDYASFLARREIYATAFLESDDGVELLARSSPGPWQAVENLRRAMRRFFEQHFSQDSGALLKALVLGDRGGISREMRDNFAAAGVTHLLAISGLHVGMLAAVAFLVVRFLGSLSTFFLLRFNLLKIATAVSLVAVFCYTAIAGALIPSVRAAIMIAVYGFAVLLDREDEIWASLCVAALLIAIYWPGAVTEASFQLSFLAVLSILWGLRKMEAWWPVQRRQGDLPQERPRWKGRARRTAFYLAVPVLATLGTGPMIAHHFGYLSGAGFLANPVIVPMVGFVIVPLGLLIGFCSLLLPALAGLLVGVADALCGWAYGGVRLFARIPMARVAVPIPNLLELALLYLGVLSFFLVRRRAHLVILLGGIGLTVTSAVGYWWHERSHRNELRITYLSVGHGDAAVVEFPGSKVLLIDAGGAASGEFDTGESIVAPFLRSRKILKVDYLLVSHPRVDHYGGMRTIIKEFAPSEFWSGPTKGRTARYEELERAVEESGLKRVYLSGGDPCRSIDRVELCVLHPSKDAVGEASVVMRLSYGRVHILFAGDIGTRDERVLLQYGMDLTGTVLKVPRHGSITASTEEFVTAVQPKLAILSVGYRNPFGLPREEILLRYRTAGSEILRTDEDGAIVIEADGQRIRYRTYRSGKKGEIEL